ncbi:MAG TPA: recombinase family protein [Nitrolancea sp.]|nr:recombinase family protein [Nitrolancea sp.]
MSRSAPEKVTPRHRERRAYVYIRQSTPKQVRENRAGQENQYALVERALALGWPRERIHIIDDDLGRSGQDGQRRGFQELVSAVSLGHVGLILAYEASRLARSNADWYTLLDLATVVGALLADTDGVFDPRDYNDRLLLGLRGMLSEAELHLLRLRMDAGRLRQVEAGTYRQHLPTGLVRLPDGRVVKDPDRQVQHAIELVFARFAALGSCQKVMRSFRDDGLLLPRHQTSGLHAGQLLWKRPAEAAIYDILRNPAYAGAFVYGRRTGRPGRRPGQRGQLRHKAMGEWTAIHRDVYPAYLRWEEFVANQARMSDNASAHARRAAGAPRAGAALLPGLVVCGHCGRQMRTVYKPQTRYCCNAISAGFGAPMCLHLDGACIEDAVVAAFFQALAPAELDLLDEVLTAQQADHERVLRQHDEQVTRAEYEARLARRQYLAVDPDNRLVAGELERRWEQALAALAAAREAAELARATAPPTPALDPALRAQLRDVGPRLPELWASGRLSVVHKKALLRSLIRRVILTRPAADRIAIKVVWVSGAYTELAARPPIWRTADLEDYERLVARVRDLSAAGHQDRAIARRLTAEGFHAARSEGVDAEVVGKIRRGLGQPSLTEQCRRAAKIDGQWTVYGLARELGVDRDWLYRRLYRGTLAASRHPTTGHYLIPDDPQLLARLRAAVARNSHR